MTPNDAPVPGPGAGRRRVLGRGPGAVPVAPPEEQAPVPAEVPAAEPEALVAEPDSEAATPDPEAAPGPEPETVPDPVTAAAPGSETVVPEPRPVVVPVPQAVLPEPEPEAVREAEAEVSEREPDAVAEPETAVPEPAAVVSGPEAAVPEPQPHAEPKTVPGASGEREASDGVFKVRLSNFEGPFDLLLQLISKHKLDVTEVALSKVTDEFMAHIRAMGPDWDLDQTTEFLVVAATLLDLKAARLLPTAEVEDEADLALLEARDLLFARLLQYRAYKRIADIFTERLDDEARRYPRTVGLEPHHAELLPEVAISIGPEGFAKLAVKAMQPRAKPQVYVDHIHAPLVSVQEQARIVVARLKELGEASFRVLVEDTDDTLTVVARFLALLELYREKAVTLEQEAALGELLVRWTGGDGEAAPMVTDEFDRPPEEPKEEKKA